MSVNDSKSRKTNLTDGKERVNQAWKAVERRGGLSQAFVESLKRERLTADDINSTYANLRKAKKI